MPTGHKGELKDEDPLVFVDSTELRRNLTAGQRAMAVAMLSPEPEDAEVRGRKGGRGKKAAINGEVSSVPHQRLSDARAVLAYSPELAQAVMQDGSPWMLPFLCCATPRSSASSVEARPDPSCLEPSAGWGAVRALRRRRVARQAAPF